MCVTTTLLFAAFILFSMSVTAQTQLPECATGCVTLVPTQCAPQDIKCICEDSNFITDVSCCVFDSCARSNQTIALQYILDICRAGGVTLTNTAATCLSTSSVLTTTKTSKGSITPIPAFTSIITTTVTVSAIATTASTTSTPTATTTSSTSLSSAAQTTITDHFTNDPVSTSPTAIPISTMYSNSSTSADPAPVDTGPPNSTKLGLGIGIGIGGTLLISAILVRWLIIRRRRTTSRGSRNSEPQYGIAIDEEPGVAIDQKDGAGVYIH